MTAIPEPTEEDFELLKIGIDIWYETNSRKSPQGQSADWQKDDLAALRLLSHFQRENERLARQRDVLRDVVRSRVPGHTRMDADWLVSDVTKEMLDRGASTEEIQFVIDAISGEGGGA